MKRDNEELRARAQADRLVDYWRDQGFEVTTWVERSFTAWEPGTRKTSGTHWLVRSDMVNGHPVKRIES